MVSFAGARRKEKAKPLIEPKASMPVQRDQIVGNSGRSAPSIRPDASGRYEI
jgi:hypothetical protein